MNRVEIEKRFQELERDNKRFHDRLSKLPLRFPSGGGGGLAIPIVENLPEIPNKNNSPKIVHWTADGAGTGDDQLWATSWQDTKWFPIGMKFTTLDGSPGS